MSSIERAMRRKRPNAGGDGRPAAGGNGDKAAPSPLHLRDQIRQVPDVTLDTERLEAHGLLTPDDDNTNLREQYRLVKRKLITRAFVRKPEGPNPSNLVQVTSCMAHEGKTFTTFNLGMCIAMERDITVLLVDADLTRSSLTKLAGLSDRPGLTEVLTGSVKDLGEVVYRTNVPRLSIIPAGEGHAHATELIASDTMRDRTLELAGRYKDRLIIFDSTPLLMDSQAATLAGHMGGVLTVVEAGRTGENMVREAIALLEGSEASQSLLLNKSIRGHGYGYYGGY